MYQELLYSQPGKRGILVGPTHSAALDAQSWVQARAREGITSADQAAVVSGRAAKAAWLLMDNALKHTRSGTPVGTLKVELSRTEFLLTVAVTDGGPLPCAGLQPFPIPHKNGNGGLHELTKLCSYWWWEGNADSPLTVVAQIELP